jgi:hypothetical protein
MTKAEAAVKSILDQGGDPKQYRQGLADHYGVTVETIDAIIASTTTPRCTDSAETIARRRMDDDARAARQGSAAYREAQHEDS